MLTFQINLWHVPGDCDVTESCDMGEMSDRHETTGREQTAHGRKVAVAFAAASNGPLNWARKLSEACQLVLSAR